MNHEMRCARCKQPMRLIGIEDYADGEELWTYECAPCENIETRDGDGKPQSGDLTRRAASDVSAPKPAIGG